MAVIQQVVQVRLLGTDRLYTYGYWVDTSVTPSQFLKVGDRVELPPNQVVEEGSSGWVAVLGSDYNGPMKMIVRRLDDVPADDGDLWAGEEWT